MFTTVDQRNSKAEAAAKRSAPSAFLVNLSLSQVIMRRSLALSFCRKGVTPHSISYSRMPTDHQSTACNAVGFWAQGLWKIAALHRSCLPGLWPSCANMHNCTQHHKEVHRTAAHIQHAKSYVSAVLHAAWCTQIHTGSQHMLASCHKQKDCETTTTTS